VTAPVQTPHTSGNRYAQPAGQGETVSVTASQAVIYPFTPPRTAEPAVPDELFAEQLRARSAGLRDRVTLLNQDVEVLHRDAQDWLLQDRAARRNSETAFSDLLHELYAQWGLGWNDIAAAVGVTPSAVRKWRAGGEPIPDKRMEVAKLAALLEMLREAGVAEPAGFLLSPVTSDVSLHNLEVYVAGKAELVLDLAFQRKRATQVLDEFDPDWPTRYTREFELFVDEDGVRSLRQR